MRTVNLDKFKSWIICHGELSKEDLASRSRISFYTIDRILQGKTVPSELQQIALCKAMEIERDELFPASKQEKSAS